MGRITTIAVALLIAVLCSAGFFDVVADDYSFSGDAAALTYNAPPPRNVLTIVGEINRGQGFTHRFGPGFLFYLEPAAHGWIIAVKQEGKSEDLARMTPPFHYVPNPREIDGWHFRDPSGAGQTARRDEHDNVPGLERDFIFSPEVGKTISGATARRQPLREEIEKVGFFGKGSVKILDYRLEDFDEGRQTRFVWMRFELNLSWPVPR